MEYFFITFILLYTIGFFFKYKPKKEADHKKKSFTASTAVFLE